LCFQCDFQNFLGVLFPILITGFFLWPQRPYSYPSQPSRDEELEYATPLLGLSQNCYNVPLKDQILSLEFAMIATFLSVISLNTVFYVASVNVEFSDKTYVSTFSFIWMCGVFMIPAIGWALDYYGPLRTIFCANSIYLLSQILAMIPVNELQILTFMCISVQNVSCYAILLCYLALVFGFKNFGKLLGTATILSAVFGLLQYPLFELGVKKFHTDFVYIRIGFVILSLPLFVMPACMIVQQKRRNSIDFLSVEE